MLIELWVVVSLIDALAKSVQATWQKWETKRHDVLEITVVTTSVAVVTFFLIGLVRGSFASVSVSVDTVALIGVIGVINIIGFWAYIKALDVGDLSLASPVKQTVPVWTAVLEPLIAATTWSPVVILSSFITVVGATVVITDPRELSFSSFRSWTVVFAGVTAIAYSTSAIIGRLVLQQVPLIVFLVGLQLVIASGFVLLYTYEYGITVPDVSMTVVGLGVLLAFQAGLSFVALTLTTAAKATVAFRASMLANIVIGVVVFDESGFKRRFAGGLLIVGAIILLVTQS